MYTMLKPLREVIAHTSVISIYGDLLAHMYVEYSARVLTFKKYSCQHVSHSAQVYNVLQLYTYCDGCAGFQSKDSLHSLCSLYIIVCIDYKDYI